MPKFVFARRVILVVLLSFISLSTLPSAVSAQVTPYSISPQEGITACSGYYVPNSITTGVAASQPHAIPKQNVDFLVTATNNNSYPIVDGRLSLDITASPIGTSGTVGQKVVHVTFPDTVTINPKGTATTTYRWEVPADIMTNRYIFRIVHIKIS